MKTSLFTILIVLFVFRCLGQTLENNCNVRVQFKLIEPIKCSTCSIKDYFISYEIKNKSKSNLILPRILGGESRQYALITYTLRKYKAVADKYLIVDGHQNYIEDELSKNVVVKPNNI